MLKNVRIWFTKTDSAKYISHLDLNNCMLRAIHKSQIPIWHTEGFHPHPFITFALPLSLGFTGLYESMDIKLIEDISNEDLIECLNSSLPIGIRITGVSEPVMHQKEIAFAMFNISAELPADNIDSCFEKLNELLTSDEILVEKKTKKGIKTINLKDDIKEYSLNKSENKITLNIILPAGNTKNINPNLIFTAFKNKFNEKIYVEITRSKLYNINMKDFY